MIPALAFGLLVALAVLCNTTMQDPLHYPWLVTEGKIQGVQSVKISFINHGLPDSETCQKKLVAMVNAAKTSCPECAVKEFACLHPPTPEQRSYLSNEPSDVPVATYPQGTIAYHSATPELATSVCQHSQTLAGQTLRLRCLPEKTSKPAPSHIKSHLPLLGFVGLLTAIGFLASWLVCYLIIKYEHLHCHLSHDHTDGGPQKFHATPTPRIGGVALFTALLVTSLTLQGVQYRFNTQEFGNLLLAALPAFGIGLAEDITKRVGVLPRLAVTMLAAGIGALLLDAVLNRLDIPGIDSLMLWLPLAIAFTVFDVAGIANATNIIDGYNGLASGYSVIVLCGLAAVGWQVGDPLVAISALIMAGTLLGFLCWNWPKGRIFLGDGGAYLLGFWLGELSVLLVARNPEVSPWFPVALLAYPIFETLFSVYRRKIKRGRSPGHPDALHLHQLIYMRVVRLHVGSQDPVHKTLRNGKVAPYFWAANVAIAGAAVVSFQNTLQLIGLSIIFCIAYVRLYRAITHWQTPSALMR